MTFSVPSATQASQCWSPSSDESLGHSQHRDPSFSKPQAIHIAKVWDVSNVLNSSSDLDARGSFFVIGLKFRSHHPSVKPRVWPLIFQMAWGCPKVGRGPSIWMKCKVWWKGGHRPIKPPAPGLKTLVPIWPVASASGASRATKSRTLNQH